MPTRTLQNRFSRCSLMLFMVLLMGLMLGFTGCHKPLHPKKNDPIVIEFWTLQLLDFKPWFEARFQAYEAQHPGIKIRWIDIPFSEGEKRTLTAMMSGHVPDVVNLNPDFSALLASRHALINVNDYVTDEERLSYLPVAWQACTLLQANDPINDQVNSQTDSPVKTQAPNKHSNENHDKRITFGLPWYLTSRITMVNASLLHQAQRRTPPSNLTELAQFAEALKAKTGHYALMPNISESGNFLKAIFYNQWPLYDYKTSANGKAAFNRPETVAFLKAWINLYQKGLMPAESITEGPRAAVDRYQSGQLALLMTGANFLNMVKENAPSIYKVTDVSPQFVPKLVSKTNPNKPSVKSSVDFSTMLLSIPVKSSHPKEAVDFALYMTNATNQLDFAKQAPVIPSSLAALNHGYFQPSAAEMTTNPMAKARQISAQQLLSSQEAYQIRPQQKKINEIIDYYVQRALLGKISPEAAIAKAEDEINAVLTP